MFYFAYGSNMSFKRLAARTASARLHGVAALPGYQLKFHKAGRDGSAKCDVVPCAHSQSVVHGVIYRISRTDKAELDKFEGLGKGYDETVITVVDHHEQTLDVNLYIATHTDPLLKPFHWYKQHVLVGAAEHNLPAHYVRQIEQVESIVDEDSDRHKQELSIYR
ncbi:MAG: gamma-glutamylcyclotransferase family protein [Gammaproteobacteria bacterium]|nr:gamma-glutamylcyclotransferase family protein [Gammaproteobacteria bacterium]